MGRALSAKIALFVAAPLAFALGRASRSHAEVSLPLPEPAAMAQAQAGCVDDAAMQANANLVARLSEVRREKEIVERAARTEARAAAERAREARASRRGAAPSREAWARMARTGTVRLRSPCGSWSESSRIESEGRRSVASAFERHRRAEAAGLEEAELELLDTAYAAANARTWGAMRAACEEGPYFAAALEESRPSSDADRIAICQTSLLRARGPEALAAVQRVAEARAAGKGVPGPSPEDRVAFAIGESTEALYDEMVRALGEERAAHVLDLGVLCTNEAIFQTSRAP